MTITTSPTHPTVGDLVTLSFSPTTAPSVTDTHEWQLTSLPPASALAAALLTDPATNDTIVTYMPDVAGAYGVTGYQYSQTATAPAFDGDGKGASPRHLELVETTTIHVYERLDLPLLTANGHGATLRIGIQDLTIRVASLVSPASEVTRLAIESAPVVSAIAAIVGTAISTLGPALIAATNEVLAKYEAHRTLTAGSVHVAPDVYNIVGRDPVQTTEEAIVVLNLLRLAMPAHLTQAGVSGHRWHSNDDGKNMPLAATATSRASATMLLCDLRYRVYERHRVQIAAPATHGAADSTNTLTAATLLELLVVAFFDFIAAATPAAPTGEPAGALAAAALYGFKVTL